MLPATRYLAAADAMLTAAGTSTTPGAWWPKACACVLRLALETAIDAYWSIERQEVCQVDFRTKLILLRRRCDRDVARRAGFAWATLSRATHHHCYELSPTAPELRALHQEVLLLAARLDHAATP